MVSDQDLEFEVDDDGNMLDDDGDIVYCVGCEVPAQKRVVVSEVGPHDGTRDYCCGCYDVYLVGVQHGRFHEAARHCEKPGRDSSQDPPKFVDTKLKPVK